MDSSMKRCGTCKSYKDESEFGKNKRMSDGLSRQCKTCHCKQAKVYRDKNKAKIHAYKKKWQECNKDKVSAHRRKWLENNRGVHLANKARYRAAKINATPIWADNEKIKDIYDNCPRGHHVDHIIPLRNQYVCGLHCEDNLQILTAEENIRKNNIFLPCSGTHIDVLSD